MNKNIFYSFNKDKTNFLIVLVLFLGIIYRLFLTQNGNFIFNMDNARDMVDVREMVVLKKMRLIGPTSAIEGFYNGPAWYYLLSIPFVLTGGYPYGEIILQIILWTVGGYFLLKLISRFGILAIFLASFLWVASNFILLQTAYAFNPNPVTLLTPLFIYLLEKYLLTRKLIFSVLTFFLAGLFFNFEMNYGVFLPIVILIAVLVSNKAIYLKKRHFWIGSVFFMLCLLPQILFDLKHQFIMTNSIIRYLSTTTELGQSTTINIRMLKIPKSFYDVLLPTFMNFKAFTNIMLLIFLGVMLSLIHTKRIFKTPIISIVLLLIIIPMLGYIFIPINVNPWHLGGVMSSAILLSGYMLYELSKVKNIGKLVSLVLLLVFIYFSINNIRQYILDASEPSHDAAVFKNEINAVDFVYQKADGKNFKVYVYLPSVIDYPYQYLFWWRGLTKYGYIPQDYAYAPNKPEYIRHKDRLNSGKNPPSSNLVFLIKQPDEIGQRHLWENTFKNYPLIFSEKLGPLIIETREDVGK